MKQHKTYFLLSLLILSAYLVQRSLLFLGKYWDFDKTLFDPQVIGSALGGDLSFSYLGMHLFWPFIISFCLLGYSFSKNESVPHDLFIAFESSCLAKFLALLTLPILALALHYYTISELFFESIEKSFRYGPVQQPPYPPSLPERITALTISFFITFSFLLSLFSLFVAFKPNEQKQADG